MKKIKPFFHFKFFDVSIELGWFRGESFKLFNFMILEVIEELNFISVISIQIMKLCFSINVEYD